MLLFQSARSDYSTPRLHFPTHKSPSVSSNAAEREARLSKPYLDPRYQWPLSPKPSVVRVFIFFMTIRQ